MQSYFTPPNGTTRSTHHTLALLAAWFSLILPLLVAGWVMIFEPARLVPPEVMYWAMFACGVLSFVAGCLALTAIGRRIDWNLLTPALLGIVFSAVLSYVCLIFGVLGTGPPNQNLLHHSQANAPIVRQG